MVTLIVVILIVVLIVAVVSMQPARFRIARSISVHAPAEAIFDQVNDFHNWAAWSPWEKLDPAMKKRFEGPTTGVGAVYSWEGNKKVGKGTLTVLENRPAQYIRIRLEFFVPFKATNMAEFTFISDAGQTVVTWAMLGEKNFLFKAMYMVIPMDKMIGRDFEKGLSGLKAIAESKIPAGAM